MATHLGVPPKGGFISLKPVMRLLPSNCTRFPYKKVGDVVGGIVTKPVPIQVLPALKLPTVPLTKWLIKPFHTLNASGLGVLGSVTSSTV